ncbi:ALI_HP2_G0000020.mRNA.1.CDS.1 [Saccharomyces cerevisiae]|nr:ALI_HP2_G0000020.mRNA.1.CDS.1 [Saccharomyces cerevisiae]CAI6378110.1 ALI_HP2_G0000020.mRNA.1.CDS.1 [Saccharomyces cerevisiae]
MTYLVHAGRTATVDQQHMHEHHQPKRISDPEKKHIWHPYTSINYPFEKELSGNLDNGTKVVDEKGEAREKVQQGYNNPRLNAAAISQINKMSHVMFGGITHKPGIDFCKKLLALLPDSMECAYW